MKIYQYSDLSEEQLQQLYQRPKLNFREVFSQVEPIIDAVDSDGDEGIRFYTKKFDGIDLDTLTIRPDEETVELDDTIKQAIDAAFDNIVRFHKAQLPLPLEVETMPGVKCQRVARPIQNVGLYVPGGTALLPSTAMMLAIPAMLAGCEHIVLATPPKPDGSIAPEIIYIAQKTGVSTILKAGGAQAVAAMAIGTASVTKCDKIFGPGNQYVTAAKMVLQNSEHLVSIDLPAGPSEVLVIADESANPAYIAIDLLSQAEHGADSQVVLLATPGVDLDALQREINDQLADLPRKEMAQQALEQSFCIVVPDLDRAVQISNNYAPEHLIIQTANARELTENIQNAGSVFLGPWSPESVGDYASGTNHTLPTYGYARMYSGVSLHSFLKFITVQELTEDGLKQIGPTVETLAELEELDAHKRAVSLRLNDLNAKNNQ